MHCLFCYKDYLIVCSATKNSNIDVLKRCTSILLSKTSCDICTSKQKSLKKIILFSSKKSDFDLAFYRLPIGFLDMLPFQETALFIESIIDQHKNKNSSKPALIDKDVFEIYFEMLNVVNAKFMKIHTGA